METLDWIRNSSDVWLNKYGDLSRCYLMGSSAGGNIIYHVGLRAASPAEDLKPLQIQGLILHHPAFGGQKRSRQSFDSNQDGAIKLPVVVYFHGGGLVSCSPDTTAVYTHYNTITTEIPAVVVSVGYRLAPQNRLPAAYEDGIEAHAGLRVAPCADDLKPLEIKGLILHHPFFGGQSRTESEMRSMDDKVIPPAVTDNIWSLCLPIGADRDHEFCNPMVGIKTDVLDKIKVLGWKIMVTGCGGDPMIDRQIEFVRKLEEHGLSVASIFEETGEHGYDVFDASSKVLINLVKENV